MRTNARASRTSPSPSPIRLFSRTPRSVSAILFRAPHRGTAAAAVFAVLAALTAPVFSVPAHAAIATTAIESFDGTLDEATWRLSIRDEIDPAGGHPGSFLHNPQTDSAVPQPIYVGPPGTPFLGNYQAAGVVSLGIDVNIYSASIAVERTRPLSLVLTSDMGTPDDPSDDCDAYTVGAKLPQPGSGWKSFSFKVPSGRPTLPSGWVIRGACAGLSQDDAWKAVITNVTRVVFPFADPDTLWYFQIWDIGLDSVRVSSRTGHRAPVAPDAPAWTATP